MWVGHTQPPGTAFFLAPVAAAAYVVPSLVASGDPADVRSLPVVLPVCVIAAEIPARMLARLAAARAAEHAEATAFAEAAQTDDLTGLGNRRRGNVLLDSLQPGDALLVLDLDHFKDVNDRLGPREGDRVLIELGHFLASHLRDADDVARAAPARHLQRGNRRARARPLPDRHLRRGRRRPLSGEARRARQGSVPR